MLICEMALDYKRQGMTLVDAMESLYQKYGYYINQVLNFGFEGEDGMKKMASIMDSLRKNAPMEIAGHTVIGHSDYQESKRYDGSKISEITLPKSNVLEYRMDDGSKLIVRPSGTEPKIKVYLSANAKTRQQAQQVIDKMKEAAQSLLVE